MSGEPNTLLSKPKVNVEYCGVCDYGGHCLALAKRIVKSTPEADVACKRGRQGLFSIEACSFEVAVNNVLIYSKLQTMALPDYEKVAKAVQDVAEGAEPYLIKGQQPIDCVIT